MAAHTATHADIAQEERRYIQVFVWLAVLTALEIGLTFLPISRVVIGTGLVLLAASKAAMVALYFMHLAHEKRTLKYIALTPAMLCVFLVLMLLPDLGGDHAPHHDGHRARDVRRALTSPGRRCVARALVLPIVVLLGCGAPGAAAGARDGSGLLADRAHGATVTAGDLTGHGLGRRLRLHALPRHLPRALDAHGGAPGASSPAATPRSAWSPSASIPDHDTPEVLADVCRRTTVRGRAGCSSPARATPSPRSCATASASPSRTTGPAASPITHSDRFVLVDRQLRIRGYYHGNDPGDLTRLVADAGRLRDDPAA